MREQLSSQAVGWTRFSFEEIAENVSERVEPSPSDAELYIGLGHLEPDSLKVRDWGSEVVLKGTKLRMRKGDILFARRNAYLRRVAIAPHDGLFSAHGLVLRARKEVILPDFLPYFMQSDVFMDRAISISVGSLSPTINWRALARELFQLPSISEQAKLVELLMAASKLVESLTDAQQATELAYEAWVGDWMRDQDWPECIAMDVLQRATVGIVVKPADLYVTDGSGVPALRSLNVLRNRLSWDNCVHIAEEGHANHQKSALSAGDVVVVRSGRPGDAAVIPELDHDLNAVDLIVSTPGPTLRSDFFCRFLNSAAGRRQFASGIAGTAQLHFNVSLFKKLKLPLPPLDVQDQFIGQAGKFQESLDSLLTRTKEAQNLRRTILRECVCL